MCHIALTCDRLGQSFWLRTKVDLNAIRFEKVEPTWPGNPVARQQVTTGQ